MRRIVFLFVAALIGVLQQSPAVAGIFFDLRAPNAASEGIVENQIIPATSGSSTLTLKPSGFLIGGTPSENANAHAFRTVFGLGVLNSNDPAGDKSTFFNSIHVDGNIPEFLRLEFSEAVRLNFVFFQFAGAGSTDRFGLAVDGTPIDLISLLGTDVIKNLHPPGFAPGFVFFPDTLPLGTTWDFLAANWGAGTFDEWNLEKVDVVPEPSCLILVTALSLVGIGWHASRRRR